MLLLLGDLLLLRAETQLLATLVSVDRACVGRSIPTRCKLYAEQLVPAA